MGALPWDSATAPTTSGRNMDSHEFDWSRNPWPARLLLLLQRFRLRRSARLWSTLLGIDAPIPLPRSLILPHPYTIVIASQVVIGAGCVIYQGVTIGADDAGRVPILEDGVVIFPGSCVIGAVRLGRNSRVGANSVVNKSVPPGATVAGAPSRVISHGPAQV